MKRLILIKQGEYHQNLFSSFTEYVNNEYSPTTDPFQCFHDRSLPTPDDQVNFSLFARMDYSMRLISTAAADQNKQIAIAHFSNDPSNLSLDPAVFSPIDFGTICEAADKHEFVIYGFVAEDNIIPDYGMASKATILTRNKTDNKIYDVVKNEVINGNSNNVANVVSYFGVIKLKNLPVYYVILDQKILRISSFIDVTNDLFRIRTITDHDGSIKENIMTPKFSGDAELAGKYHIFTKETELTISVFEGNSNILRLENVDVSNVVLPVKSSYKFESLPGGIVKVNVDSSVGYIKIKIDAGDFFEVTPDKDDLEYEYIIHKI